jgi:hypothetical protein
MRVVGVVLPALVGCLLILFGITTVAPGLQPGEPGPLGEPGGPALTAVLRIAVIPFAIGIVLLLASATAVRRTRLGYVLGLTIGLLMAVAGLAGIAVEIPYLQQGGESAALGGGIVIAAIAWAIVWGLYAWRFSKSKPDFAPALTPADRRLAVIVVVVVLLAAATFVGLDVLQANATANAPSTES